MMVSTARGRLFLRRAFAQSSTPQEFDARMRKNCEFYSKLVKGAALPKIQ